MALQSDYRDMLAAFAAHEVEYLVLVGYAVTFHGAPRFTNDLDLWVRATPANLERVKHALVAFGAPDVMVSQLENATEEDVLWMGLPPVRIDIVKGVPGGDFAHCYGARVNAVWDGVEVSVVSRADLIHLNRASGRAQDLADVDALERSR